MLNTRQSQNRRRGRGRGPQNGSPRGNESRIDNRARSNAPQMLEKFKNLAREAQMQGDRVMTEYYLQFADHYFRIVAESKARQEEARPRRDDWQNEDGTDGDINGGESSAYASDEGDNAADDIDSAEQPERAERPRRDNARDTARDTGRDNGRDNGREGNRDNNRDGNRDSGRDNGRDRPERAERPERTERNPARNARPARTPKFDADDGSAAGSISIDILPPALGVVSDPIPDLDEVPATPRRRVARPRKAAVEAES